MMQDRVAIFTPYYRMQDGDLSLTNATFEYLARQVRAGYSVFMRNDPQPNDPTTRTGKVLNHFEQFRVGFERFLASSAEYLLIVESDMLPHTGTVSLLLACEADLAFAPYTFRHGAKNTVNLLKYRKRADRNPGDPYTVSEFKKLYSGSENVVNVSGSAFGVTMLSRRCVETVPLELGKNRNVFVDTAFIKSAWRTYDLTFKANVRCVAKHYDKETGLWLDPRL